MFLSGLQLCLLSSALNNHKEAPATIMEERRGAKWGISEQKQALTFILNHYQESTVENMGREGE